MKKYVIYLIFTVSALFFAGCNDNDGTIPIYPEPPAVTHDLNNGFGKSIQSRNIGQNMTVVLSDMSGTSVDDFKGNGSFVSLKIVASADQNTDTVAVLPSGTYTVTNSEQNTGSIVTDAGCYFGFIESGARETYKISGGSITVVHTSGSYDIKGELESGNEKYKFEYKGAIALELEIDDVTSAGFDVMRSVYSNEHTYSELNGYRLELSNGKGQDLTLNIIAAPGELFTAIAEGAYRLSPSVEALAICAEGSRFNNGWKEYDIIDAELNIKASSADEYVIEGTVYGANSSVMEFTYSGPANVDKVELKFVTLDMHLYGTYWSLMSFSNFMMLNIGDSTGKGEEMNFSLFFPFNRYYDNELLEAGEYLVVDDYVFNPYSIVIDYDVSDGLFIFRNNRGGSYRYDMIERGGLNIKSASKDGSGKYVYDFEGTFYFECDDKLIEAEVEFQGSANDVWKHRNTNPFSTLASDIEYNDAAQAVYDWLGEGYWEFDGGPADFHYMELSLRQQDGMWYEWWSDDGLRKNRFITFGINISTDAETIPTGTFVLDYDHKWGDRTLIPGVKQGELTNNWYGSIYFSGDYGIQSPLACIGDTSDPGSMTITSLGGGQYSITWKAWDDKGYKLTGSYTGTIIDLYDDDNW